MTKIGTLPMLLLCAIITYLSSTASAEQPETFASNDALSAETASEPLVDSSRQNDSPRSVAEPFIPEKEWKQIQPGQAIPAGLHVRMNFQTGINEAKLMDSDENASAESAVSIVASEIPPETEGGEKNDKDPVYLREDLEEMLKNIATSDKYSGVEKELSEEEKSRVKQKFRSMEELKKDFAELNMQIQTDREILKELMAKYRAKDRTVVQEAEEKLMFLQDMEYYVHQIDNAVDFLEMGGLDLIKDVLKEPDLNLHASAVNIVGAAAQNNPKAQILLLEHGILPILIETMANLSVLPYNPTFDSVLSRTVFALSASVRNFPLAQHRFLELHGIKALEGILFHNEQASSKASLKVIRLIADLLAERNDTREALTSASPVDREVDEKRLLQYGDALEYAIARHWPSILMDFSEGNEDDCDARREVLRILEFLHSVIRAATDEALAVETALRHLRSNPEPSGMVECL